MYWPINCQLSDNYNTALSVNWRPLSLQSLQNIQNYNNIVTLSWQRRSFVTFTL